MKRVLVTGASGYVGTLLLQRLRSSGFAITAAVRMPGRLPDMEGIRQVVVGQVGGQTDWNAALDGCDAIIHLAAQVPGRGVGSEAFDEVNDRGTARLVEQAMRGQSKLFILGSSIFAAGELSSGRPLDDSHKAAPATDYGRSKYAAEGHMATFTGNGRTAIVLRPPLVYGAGAKGNWQLLQRLAASSLPLPFASIKNRRTLIARENLVDAITHLAGLEPNRLVAGTYSVADSETVSLREILTLLRQGVGRSPRLFPMPPSALAATLAALGRRKMAQSLLGDLEVDSSRFRNTFGWSPPIRTHDGIVQAGADFLR